MYIGYNIQKANEAMTNINDAYVSVCKKVVSQWEELKAILRKEWVGADEQDFEKQLLERIKNMLSSSRTLTSNTVDVLYELAVAWANFQDKNTISGNSVGVAQSLISGLDKPAVSSPPEITFTALTFNATTNMGLSNKNSDNTISSALSSFVKSVKSESSNLFESIDMSAAFYGSDQIKKLNKLRDTVGESVGVIATSLNDFEKAMKQLTEKSYKSSDDAVGDTLNEARDTVKKSLNDLGETRWK